ncbi:Microsomal glutathione S-transferase 3 [Allomyces arbusculus]|nr:Microsomal glutathione S-transferase 3 [Allomyces arbusculus]
MSVVTLSSEFGYVVLSLLAFNLHYTSSSRFVMALRRKYGIAYPDMGSGRYTTKLTDAQWHEFNSAQRVHQNYLEQMATVNTAIFCSGIFNPTWTAGLTAVYILGREVFIRGYINQGPDARLRGSVIFWPAFFGMIGIATHGAVKLLGYL